MSILISILTGVDITQLVYSVWTLGVKVVPCILNPCLVFSRDEVKTKWSVSDFIKAFIKFHGHVYLSKSLEKLNNLREKLEEQFQVMF